MIELPLSTYYYRPTARQNAISDVEMVNVTGDIHEVILGYGYRRVTLAFKDRGNAINHKRVTRIMKEHS